MDRLAELLGMDAQLLNGIINGIFGLFLALGYAWMRRKNAEHASEIEKVRSDIELRKQAQEADTKERQSIIELLRAQVTVTTKMADNYREDADRRYTQEQQRHVLIKEFTGEQSKTVDAIGTVNTQLVAMSTGIETANANTTAARQLTIELDKSIEGLSNDIERLTKTIKDGLDSLKTEVVTALDKVSREPLAADIRKTLLEAESRILEHIDKLKTDETPKLEAVSLIIQTEEKPNVPKTTETIP